MNELVDSLERARREHEAAVARGDAQTADIIARAIDVLEQAIEGHVPAQRQSTD